MIIAFDYPGPFFNDLKIVSSDGKPQIVPPEAHTFVEVKPRGEAPWTLTMGSSTVLRDIESADVLVVYQGQKSSILKAY